MLIFILHFVFMFSVGTFFLNAGPESEPFNAGMPPALNDNIEHVIEQLRLSQNSL